MNKPARKVTVAVPGRVVSNLNLDGTYLEGDYPTGTFRVNAQELFVKLITCIETLARDQELLAEALDMEYIPGRPAQYSRKKEKESYGSQESKHG